MRKCREDHATTRKNSCFLLRDRRGGLSVGGEGGKHMNLMSRKALRLVFMWLTDIPAHWHSCLDSELPPASFFLDFPVFRRPSLRSHCLTPIHYVSKLYLLFEQNACSVYTWDESVYLKGGGGLLLWQVLTTNLMVMYG